MKNQLLKSVIVAIFSCITAISSFAQQKNTAFKNGEELTFKVSYGFLDAAEAKMKINPYVNTIKSRPVYRIDVTGETLGLFKLFKVNDTWGSYLDTVKIIPHQSYRFIEEGKYRKNERVVFDHDQGKAMMRLYDRENKKIVETKSYDVPKNVQDIVSGFYYLRTMDMKKFKKGDIITLTGFFDKEIYNLKLIFEGKERLSTQVGDFETFVLTPIMPSNKLFRGEHPVTIWVSDDQNKIPLKIKARLMVGALNMDITKATGLRNN
ncbi:Protein of unknown function (DUF3108) [Belliella baltica DSM 15883]|uniref:DUF3108 domain-containing protein n=1 Tax=Belliella baltica (strain DSM 15883 / CIP 108006 / LMG 21964 / BA134) TaxID=866536 RepID=I3Z0E7_BELBD|nr:DUF3108 domain-containing protein [Belliella baltica]AFL82715.1 Protein of unknown function (DUF3108) [Belliella baltica DSM 15883]